MKIVLKSIKIFGSIFFITLIHALMVNFLPYPFNRVNVAFLALAWLVIYASEAYVLWVTVAVAFLIETFSFAPFGVGLCAFAISIAVIRWVLFTLFTNRSVWIVFITGLLGIVLYRVLYFTFLVFISIMRNKALFFAWYPVALDTLWEILFTATSLTGIYFVTTLFSKRLNPRYIAFQHSAYDRKSF